MRITSNSRFHFSRNGELLKNGESIDAPSHINPQNEVLDNTNLSQNSVELNIHDFKLNSLEIDARPKKLRSNQKNIVAPSQSMNNWNPSNPFARLSFNNSSYAKDERDIVKLPPLMNNSLDKLPKLSLI